MSGTGGISVVDLCRKNDGRLWCRKTSPPSDGLVLDIIHSVPSKDSLPHPRLVRFLHVAFDDSGSRLIAADLQGNVFLFKLAANEFVKVLCFGAACTAVAFGRRRVGEAFVATADATVKIVDVGSKEIVACLKGHVDPVQTISVHQSGRYAVTSSEDTAQLWDLETLERKRKLTIKNSPGVLKVFFAPQGNDILTCFRDDSIFCWDAETLTCKFQLPAVAGPGESSPMFRDVATDGRHFVAGGRSNRLYVFNLESKTLLRVVQLPERIVDAVKSLSFVSRTPSLDSPSTNSPPSLTSSSLVLVLSSTGSLLLLDIETCQVVVVFDSSSSPDEDERIKEFAVSPTGRHIVLCGERIKLHLFDKLLASLTRRSRPSKVKTITPTRVKSRRLAPVSRRVVASKGRRKRNEEAHEGVIAEPLTPKKLRHILETFGQFPSKYRLFIWRMILKLPENHQAFAELVDKGTHPAFRKLEDSYPVKDQRAFRALQKTLSHLAHWAPIFGESTLTPLIAFPFVKMFVNNHLHCFEVIVSVLLNFGQHFFEFFPNPPVNVLAAIENILCFHAPTLLEHFAVRGVTAIVYAWPLLETLFSEILTARDWLTFFDFALSSHPSFILFAVVAYAILNKAGLLACDSLGDFRFFFRHHSPVSVDSLVSTTERLSSSTPSKIHPQKNAFFADFVPLPTGQYPIFNGYPEKMVNFEIREKERTEKEADEVAKQERIVRDLERRSAARHIQVPPPKFLAENRGSNVGELRRLLRLDPSVSDLERRKSTEAEYEDVHPLKSLDEIITSPKQIDEDAAAVISPPQPSSFAPGVPIVQSRETVPTVDSRETTDCTHEADPSSSLDFVGVDNAFRLEGRRTFEARERELLRHIQTLRAKLAAAQITNAGGSSRGGEEDVTATKERRAPYPSPFAQIGGGDGPA